ncbi:MAG TPA: TRAFs-binding domain-containing protein, partial [Methylomirabilota bacterium]|nr:TRAFs-binding domain-containing protein [Methylomirabilota bacterium]
LAEEAPTRVFRVEAYRTAGKALLSLGQYKLALTQYENALAIKPKDLESQRQKGLLLGRLKKYDEAKEWIEAVIKEFPDDAESWALLGRIEKDGWVDIWRADGKSVADMQRDALQEEGLLREAVNAYATGFRKDPTHYYSGINAVTLLYLHRHLSGKDERPGVRMEMEGSVRWDVRGALEKDPKDYWARVTLADLEVLASPKDVIEDAYKSAVAVAEKDWFQLSSSCQQLLLLKDLDFRTPEAEAGLAVLNRALARINPPEKAWVPRQVFIFSGHMIDAPDRKEPRFPPDKEKIAAAAIAAKLDELKAGEGDLAFCGGTCGGDLLFAEACLERGLGLDVRIPFDEPTFLHNSVAFAGENWVERYYQMKSSQKTKLYVMPDEQGPAPNGVNPYARNNFWRLYTALAWGPDKVRFICLWNRKSGGGVGGTQHMVETVQKYSGRVYIVDTTKLW